jgi:hypothetical protein
MAQKSTKSQRSGQSRRKSSASRSRAQGGNGDRPALEAMRADSDADREYRAYVRREEQERAGPPDVLLDVPELKVDLIHFELDDLDAHVALKARVLDLIKLNVGVDVHLSRVKLDIKGVQAEVVLKARLDHVTAIVDRLLTTLDRNPELVQGLSRAVSDMGQGAGEAVGKTGGAAKEIGGGAESALKDVGQGAGQATGDIGQGAGQAVGQVGQGAGQAVGGAGQALGGNTQGTPGQGGQPDGGPPAPGSTAQVAREAAKTVVRELGHAASDEARELGLAATRKVRELGERREHRRAEKRHATEAAVRLADELGIDLAEVSGSGSDGRITVNDVREAQAT